MAKIKPTVRNTVESRTAQASKLARQFDRWITLTDAELFAEVKQVFPACTEATRDECLKFLTMGMVYDMVPAEVAK